MYWTYGFSYVSMSIRELIHMFQLFAETILFFDENPHSQEDFNEAVKPTKTYADFTETSSMFQYAMNLHLLHAISLH